MKPCTLRANRLNIPLVGLLGPLDLTHYRLSNKVAQAGPGELRVDRCGANEENWRAFVIRGIGRLATQPADRTCMRPLTVGSWKPLWELPYLSGARPKRRNLQEKLPRNLARAAIAQEDGGRIFHSAALPWIGCDKSWLSFFRYSDRHNRYGASSLSVS